jgi:hypothetical protein
MRDSFGKRQKPLFVIRRPVRAKGYRSRFKPFETTRFLDASKLAKLRKQSLEVGILEAAGQSATVVAEIRQGAVIGLSLRGCVGCGRPAKNRIDRKTLLAIEEKTRGVRGGKFQLPVRARTATARSGDIFIPIWPWPPIVIILEPSTFCAAIRVGATFCLWCPDTGGTCLL